MVQGISGLVQSTRFAALQVGLWFIEMKKFTEENMVIKHTIPYCTVLVMIGGVFSALFSFYFSTLPLPLFYLLSLSFSAFF